MSRYRNVKFKEKMCPICGNLFMPNAPSKTYCTPECASKAHYANKIAARKRFKAEGLNRIAEVSRMAKEAGFGASYGLYVAMKGL